MGHLAISVHGHLDECWYAIGQGERAKPRGLKRDRRQTWRLPCDHLSFLSEGIRQTQLGMFEEDVEREPLLREELDAIPVYPVL